MSCFVEYDRLRPGRKSIALCGDWCDERDISATPTCPSCRAALLLTAEDVFGSEPPGASVRSTLTDPLRDYKPRQ